MAAFVLMAAVTGGALSWFASTHPDGLEWSIERVTGKGGLPEAEQGIAPVLKGIQEKTAFLPDYGFKPAGGGAEGKRKPLLPGRASMPEPPRPASSVRPSSGRPDPAHRRGRSGCSGEGVRSEPMTFDAHYFDIGRLDRLSYRDTFVHRLDPRVKVIATMLLPAHGHLLSQIRGGRRWSRSSCFRSCSRPSAKSPSGSFSGRCSSFRPLPS